MAINTTSMGTYKDFDCVGLNKQLGGIDQRSDCTFCAVGS